MAIKNKISGAWEEVDTLKVPVNSAYQEADHANALVDGAWQEVWGSGIPFTATDIVNSKYTKVSYEAHGSFANFGIYATIPAQGNASADIEFSGEVNLPAYNGNRYATFDVDIDVCSGVNHYIRAEIYDVSGHRDNAFTLHSITPSGAYKKSFTFSVGQQTVKTIKIFIFIEGKPAECNGTIKNLVVDGQKCRFK